MGSQTIKKLVLDTNILLRLVVGDVKKQQQIAIDLFLQAEKGEIILIIHPVVLAEVCFVLSTFYDKSDKEVSDMMEALLTPSWLEIEHRKALSGMWRWYSEGMHFVDSYLLALEKYEGVEMISFDKKLNKKRSK